MSATPEQIAAGYIRLLPLLYRKLDKPSLGAEGRRTPADLTHLQYHVLEELFQQEDGAAMTQLARTLQISKQQLTPLTAKLEEKAYIVKQPDARDKRLVRLRLTEKGQKTVSGRWMDVHHALSGHLELLDEEDRTDLAYAIDKMTRILARLQPGRE